MAQYDIPSQLSGLFKQVYSKGLEDLRPENALLTTMVKFNESEKTGDYYHQPVILTHEGGVSFAAPSDGAFGLVNSVAMTTKDAQVQGYMNVLRSSVSYDLATKSATGTQAFEQGVGMVLENMVESLTKHVEVSCLYGQSPKATTASSSNVGATSTTVTFTAASWAPGIFLGHEDTQVVFYNSSTLVSSSTDAVFTIGAIDVENRTILITGSATGISALDTGIAAGARDMYFFGSTGYGTTSGTTPAGTYSAKEMAGVNKILTNSSTLFNIDASSYKLWAASSYSAGSAALTFNKLVAAITQAAFRGLKGKVTVLCGLNTWTNLAQDQAALRKYDGSYSEDSAKNGFKVLKFYHMNGEIEVIGTGMVKGGEAFVLADPSKKWRRIGSSDITFKTPGRGEDIFTQLASNAGYEMRLFCDQAIFTPFPAHNVKITSIVST